MKNCLVSHFLGDAANPVPFSPLVIIFLSMGGF